jgi:hypothetical protein
MTDTAPASNFSIWGSDICHCGDFRGEHRPKCKVCPCVEFRFCHRASYNDQVIWNKYHANRPAEKTMTEPMKPTSKEEGAMFVGRTVQWQGQDGVCSGIVRRVTEPQPGNFVLWLDDDFPLNHRSVLDSAPAQPAPAESSTSTDFRQAMELLAKIESRRYSTCTGQSILDDTVWPIIDGKRYKELKRRKP